MGKKKGLTHEEEYGLWERMIKGDEKAFQELVNCNLGFVLFEARKFAKNQAQFKELVMEGYVALVESARKFDASKGCKLITFAQKPIRGSITKYLKKENPMENCFSPEQDNCENNFIADACYNADNSAHYDSLSGLIIDYVDNLYYKGAGRMYLAVMDSVSSGKSLGEAADEFGLPFTYVKSLNNEVKSMLRKKYYRAA